MTILDATVVNTGVFVRMSTTSPCALTGSIVINNAKLTNTPVAVGVLNGEIVLAGGTMTIASWGQGNVYSGSNPTGSYVQGNIIAADKPSVLLDGAGRIFGKGHPQYADYAVSQFVSVRSKGAKGDGVTDDTAALTNIFNQARILNFTAIFQVSNSLIVRWLCHYIFRCRHVCRDIYVDHSSRSEDCRRGLVRYCGNGPFLPGR